MATAMKKTGNKGSEKLSLEEKGKWLEFVKEFIGGDAEEYKFPPTLSSLERKYIHELAIVHHLSSKSYGSKKDNSRYTVLSKINPEKVRTSTKPSTEFADHYYPLTEAFRNRIDSFLQKYPSSIAFERLTQSLNRDVSERSKLVHRRRTTSKLKLERRNIQVKCRDDLPIFAWSEKIVDLVRQNQVVLLSGDTGCGKSTQVPQYLLNALHQGLFHANENEIETQNCPIICTQPRRISAIGLAERVAFEFGEEVGNSVGYQIRFNKQIGPHCQLSFLTVGILLRRLLSDPLLLGTKVIIVDEIHERSSLSDFLLTILKTLLLKRTDLKLVLMSATMQTELFQTYFNSCPHINVPSYTFPVHTFYLDDIVELTKCKPGAKLQYQRALTTLPKSFYRRSNDPNIEDSKLEIEEDSNDFSQEIPAFKPPVVVEPVCLSPADKLAAAITPIGWVDTYRYIPTDGSISSGTEIPATFQQNPDFSSTIAPSDSSFPSSLQATSTHSLSPSSAVPNLKDSESQKSRIIPVNVPLSQLTILTVNQFENNPMKYIDYNLVFSTLTYICKDFPRSTVVKQTRSLNHGDLVNGSILVFCPGWSDITTLRDMLLDDPEFQNKHKYIILPLHGMMDSKDQREIFRRPPPGCRKIILSTNIAETSITIDDVVYVVDTGVMRDNFYDAEIQVGTLSDVFVSKANAMQRAGRAGRTRPGVCFRLYTKNMYRKMDDYHLPELLRTPLGELFLQIKSLGLGDITEFLSSCIEPTDLATIQHTLKQLKDLGALDDHENLTKLGQRLAQLPIEPKLGKMILYGLCFQCLEPMLVIAACLSSPNLFIIPSNPDDGKIINKLREAFANGTNSDYIANLNVYLSYVSAMKAHRAVEYCQQNFLSLSTMTKLFDVINQFYQLLNEIEMLEDSHAATPQLAWYNLNSQNLYLIEIVAAAALYPNVAEFKRQRGNSVIWSTNKRIISIGSASVNRKAKLANVSISRDVSNDSEYVKTHAKNQHLHSIPPLLMYSSLYHVTGDILAAGTSFVYPATACLLFGTELLLNPVKLNTEYTKILFPNVKLTESSSHIEATHPIESDEAKKFDQFHVDGDLFYIMPKMDAHRIHEIRVWVMWFLYRRLINSETPFRLHQGKGQCQGQSFLEKDAVNIESAIVELLTSSRIESFEALSEYQSSDVPSAPVVKYNDNIISVVTNATGRDSCRFPNGTSSSSSPQQANLPTQKQKKHRESSQLAVAITARNIKPDASNSKPVEIAMNPNPTDSNKNNFPNTNTSNGSGSGKKSQFQSQDVKNINNAATTSNNIKQKKKKKNNNNFTPETSSKTTTNEIKIITPNPAKKRHVMGKQTPRYVVKQQQIISNSAEEKMKSLKPIQA